jgi:hypothetical protein
VANQRGRKTTIDSVNGPDGEAKSIEEIVEITTKYYKDLFKHEVNPDINIATDFF